MKKIFFLIVILTVILRGDINAQRSKRTVRLPEKTPASYAERPGWKMLWHDEFDNDSINGHVWWPQTNENKGTLTCFTPRQENVNIKDGYLHLVNRKEDYHGFPYTGGMVFTADKIAVNSRVEASFKIPKGKSLWPCFWLLGGMDTAYQEIDIAEFGCSNTTQYEITNHFWNPKKKEVTHNLRKIRTRSKEDGKRLDLSADFHVYAVEWTTAALRFYLDDQLIFEVFEHIPTLPMPIILSMGVGGTDGNPEKETAFPAEFTFDYVRVYTKTEKL